MLTAATSGNQTRAARMAGEHSTTEPTLLALKQEFEWTFLYSLFEKANHFKYLALCTHTARLAQSVEHETLNLRVVGSSPTLGNIIFFILFF